MQPSTSYLRYYIFYLVSTSTVFCLLPSQIKFIPQVEAHKIYSLFSILYIFFIFWIFIAYTYIYFLIFFFSKKYSQIWNEIFQVCFLKHAVYVKLIEKPAIDTFYQVQNYWIRRCLRFIFFLFKFKRWWLMSFYIGFVNFISFYQLKHNISTIYAWKKGNEKRDTCSMVYIYIQTEYLPTFFLLGYQKSKNANWDLMCRAFEYKELMFVFYIKCLFNVNYKKLIFMNKFLIIKDCRKIITKCAMH